MHPSTPNSIGILSMQSYLETDMRRKCLLIVKKPQKHSIRSRSLDLLSGWNLQTTNRLAHTCDERGKAHPPHQKWLQTRPPSKTVKKDRGTGKYDNLTTAQKAEMIVADNVQWLKLQQSLRDAGELWTSVGLQQVLREHVQQRIDEMEQLEYAMAELNVPICCSFPIHEEEIEEQSTVVGTLQQFARKHFFTGTSQLISQERRDNHSQRQRRRATIGFKKRYERQLTGSTDVSE